MVPVPPPGPAARGPAPGPGGAQPPLPGSGSRGQAAGSPAVAAMARLLPARGLGAPDGLTPDVITSGQADDDWDADADLARLLDDIDSGREQVPPDDDGQRPAVMFTLGQAADVDPAELAAMAGPDGLAGEVFTQQRPAGAPRPGPLLAILAENAAEDLGALSGNQLLGLVSAARRLQNRAEYLELSAVAEFTRRARAAYRASAAGGGTASSPPRGHRR
jgi:hypothetical protein